MALLIYDFLTMENHFFSLRNVSFDLLALSDKSGRSKDEKYTETIF